MGQARTYAITGGHWFNGTRFVRDTWYVVQGRFRHAPPARIDTTIELDGAFVVPPFGEAHNHNIDSTSRLAGLLTRYRQDGVFFVQNPSILPASRDALTGVVNVPASLDVTFALGGLTGPGGHPWLVAKRNLDRGAWTVAQTDGAFYWTVANRDELEAKMPQLLAQRPDFIKVFLLYADEYARRLADSSSIGWRGIDPALLPVLVTRAHAAGKRVVAHIETAADFRIAVQAGVDQIAHMPGFRGDERVRLPVPSRYLLTEADARLAMQRGTVVITTLGGGGHSRSGRPDSSTRRALDVLHRENLRTLQRQRVRLAIGSDTYSDDSRDEVAYLRTLRVLSDTTLLRIWAMDTPRAIFPSRRLGRFVEGFEAHLLALDCNPLMRFDCTTSIRLRMKAGQLLTP